MKQLPRIASRLYCEPWNILPQVHAQIGRQFRGYLEAGMPAVPMPPTPDEAPGAPPLVSAAGRGLALLTIDGVIGKHLSQLEMACGGVDLVEVDRALALLVDEPAVDTVVMAYNTPGGVGIGLGETAGRIRELAAAGKRVIAFADYQCCSAGYWLAAAADELFAAPSAQVGSIGTYIAALDDSRAWELEGLELKLFRDGQYKALGHEGKRWTAAEEEFLQAEVDRHGAKFKNWIRQRRGLQDGDMQGQWFTAEDAPPGVVDGLVRDLDELIEGLLADGVQAVSL